MTASAPIESFIPGDELAAAGEPEGMPLAIVGQGRLLRTYFPKDARQIGAALTGSAIEETPRNGGGVLRPAIHFRVRGIDARGVARKTAARSAALVAFFAGFVCCLACVLMGLAIAGRW